MSRKTLNNSLNFALRSVLRQGALLTLLLILTLSVFGEVYAASLGMARVKSGLGEPLSAEIDLRATDIELQSLQAKLKGAAAASGIKLMVTKKADGKPIIKISNPNPNRLPYIDLPVEIVWDGGNESSNYVLFLNPPPDIMKQTSQQEGPDLLKTPPIFTAQQTARPTEKRKSIIYSGNRASPQPWSSPNSSALQPIFPEVESSSKLPGEKDAEPIKRKILKGETAYSIAERFRPEGVTLEQMVAGMLRYAPKVFEDGGRAVVGSILVVPSIDDANSISATEAKRVVHAKVTGFERYKSSLGRVVAALPTRSSRQSRSCLLYTSPSPRD